MPPPPQRASTHIDQPASKDALESAPKHTSAGRPGATAAAQDRKASRPTLNPIHDPTKHQDLHASYVGTDSATTPHSSQPSPSASTPPAPSPLVQSSSLAAPTRAAPHHQQHFLQQQSVQQVYCSRCPLQFPTQNDLRLHYSSAHSPESGPLQKASPQLQQQLQHLPSQQPPSQHLPSQQRQPHPQHQQQKYRGQAQVSTCSLCTKLYNSFADEPSRPALHQALFYCSQCNTFTRGKPALEEHVRETHDPARAFQCCDDCLQCFCPRPDDPIPGAGHPRASASFQQQQIQLGNNQTGLHLPAMFERETDPSADPNAYANTHVQPHDMTASAHAGLSASGGMVAGQAGPLGNGSISPPVSAAQQFALGVVGDGAQTAFPNAQQAHGLFTDRPDPHHTMNALGPGSGMFMQHQEEAQLQHQEVGMRQQQRGKRIPMQGRQRLPPRQSMQIMGQPQMQGAVDVGDEYARHAQQYQVQDSDRNGHLQQQRNDRMYPQERQMQPMHMHPNQQLLSREQAHQQQQQHPNAMRGAPAFGSAQVPEGGVPGSGQFVGFDDGQGMRRRSAMPIVNNNQHPAVVLGFSDNYMQPNEAMNDGRGRPLTEPLPHHPRDGGFSGRFDGDTGAMVAPGMGYDMDKSDIDHAKRISGSVGQDGLGVDRTLGMGGSNHRVGNGRVVADARTLTGTAPFVSSTVEKRIACESCGQLFGDMGSLKRHAARAHRAATGKGPVFCSQCNASLKNDQNLRRHIAVCHSGEQENRCDMCSASFSSRGSLRIHQQQVHAIPGASGKAAPGRGGRGGRGAAGASGARGASRAKPMGGVAKSPKSDKSYVCDMCTDTFKWKGNLKRHRELRHLQLRPFVCHVCSANFGTKSNMRVHLITHNNAAPPK